MNKSILMACTFLIGFMLLPTKEAAAKACVHAWAVPGIYTITGNFRGSAEKAGARLTQDCRITIRLPGVYSGTKVRRAGKCIRFSFRVDGIKKAFSAKWCNKIGYIPWNGKRVRAKVKLVKTAGLN